MKLALTFDAEFPDQTTTSRNDPAIDIDHITSALFQYGVPASFFVQGRWAQTYPHLVRKMVEMEYSVESHGFYHAPSGLLTPEGFERDVYQSIEVLQKSMDGSPAYYRYPYGSEAHAREMEGTGLTPVGWDIAHGDWLFEDWRPSLAAFKRTVLMSTGGVVLLHTWPAGTADGTKKFIKWCLDEGHEFVTLDEWRLDNA